MARFRRKKKQPEAFVTETYNTASLHEERQYGLYWYAWLWKILRPVLIFLCAALIVIGMVTVGYNRIYNRFFAPVNSLSAEVVEFEIPSGTSVREISEQLEEAKLLRSGQIFRYLVQFEGLTNSISYGTFKLSPAMSVNDVIRELTSGSQTNERVITIVPGWNCEQIAQYLVGIHALDSTDEFLRLCNDTDRFSQASYALRNAVEEGALEGRKYALEGYLAPDTYRVFLSATPESLINTLLLQNNKVVDEAFYTDNTEYTIDEEGQYHEVERFKTPLTMDQTIVLASIIEKEASTATDRRRVSAVMHNRLRAGMRLESDPTAAYLFSVSGFILPESVTADSNVYNTYVVDGLPAGPICNPSADALNAALYPDETYIEENYLYFCAGEPESNTLIFARTLEEHQANVARYRPLWVAYDLEHAD